MSRIGTSLVPYNEILSFGEQIYEFAFGFIAPLQTDYGYSRH
jgi:hypothetical protein